MCLRGRYEAAAIAVRAQAHSRAHAHAPTDATTSTPGPLSVQQMGTTPLIADPQAATLPPAAAPLHGSRLLPPLESESPLRLGDVVLAEVLPSFVDVYRHRTSDFILIKEVGGSQPPRVGSPMDNARRFVAGVGMILMVVGASTQTVSLLIGVCHRHPN
jgi:hypothetical protein